MMGVYSTKSSRHFTILTASLVLVVSSAKPPPPIRSSAHLRDIIVALNLRAVHGAVHAHSTREVPRSPPPLKMTIDAFVRAALADLPQATQLGAPDRMAKGTSR
jgi:hypothetical protein